MSSAQSRATQPDTYQEARMHHDLNVTLASSREQELRSVARRADHLMARELRLQDDAPPRRRASRAFLRSSRSARP
jgi:hypothetical protein